MDFYMDSMVTGAVGLGLVGIARFWNGVHGG
jgi:hypothetical protein